MRNPPVAVPLLVSWTLGLAASGQVTFPDLIHHWPADGSAVDLAGAADGVLNGGVGFVQGQFGQAFDIEAGEFITFGAQTCNFGPSDFTLSFWVRLDAAEQVALFSKRPLCGLVQMIDVRVLASGEVVVEFSGPQFSNYTSLQTSRGLDVGTWHHVAWVRRSLTLEIHIDGSLAATQDSPGLVTFSNGAVFTAGKSPCTGSIEGTQPFDGALDEIQVYLRALDPSEIAALAARPSVAADLDRNGVVDGADLGVLLGGWGPCGESCFADLNGDGIVDGADLGALLGQWG